MELVRNIFDAKLMFCDVQELVNSYSIQFLAEFMGNISIREIEDTIKEIVIRNPGSNVFKNKNNLVVSSDIIYVKELTFDSELYMFNENFFNETTDFNKHSIELYLLNIKEEKQDIWFLSSFMVLLMAKVQLIIDQIPFSTVITEHKNKTNIAICSYKNQILKDTLRKTIEDMEGVE